VPDVRRSDAGADAAPSSSMEVRLALGPARRGVAIVFVVFGALAATWVSRLPLLKEHLGLSAGELSLALLASPIGLFLAVRVASPLVAKWTSGRVTRWGVAAGSAAMALPAFAWDLGSLAAALFVFGLAMGVLEIAMNTQAVAIERGFGRPIMSGIHGMYSIGMLLGAGVGALAAHADVDPRVHFVVAAGVLAALGMWTARWLLGPEADAPVEGSADAAGARFLEHPYLWAIGAVALCSFFAEGAVDDWSGVYLHEVQDASFAVAPLGAAACAVGMAVGRFCGDAVIARHGRWPTLRRTSLLAAAGMTVAVAAPTPAVAVAGYGVLGVGVATIVPIAFTLAGNTTGVPPVWAISRVTVLGYVGLFGSPPVIGAIAEAASLAAALVVPAILLALVAPLSRVARTRQPAAALT
jgi:fucose permease